MFDHQFRIAEFISFNAYFLGLMISVVIMWSSSKYSQLPALILMYFYCADRRNVPDFHTVERAKSIIIQVKLKRKFSVG